MRSKVKVTLQAREEVVIEVEHEDDDDPCDLTNDDRERAMDLSSLLGLDEVEVDSVELVE